MDSFSIIGTEGFYQFKINHSKTKDMGIGNRIVSPKFRVGEHEWAIWYYPQGTTHDNHGEYVSVFLELQAKSVDVVATFQFVLLDKHGNVSSTTLKKFLHTFKHPSYCLGVHAFLQRNELEKAYIKEGCFTLNVSITIHDGSHKEPHSFLLGHSVDSPQTISNYKFLHDRLRNLREKNKQTDVTFAVDGEKFVAHRLILAAHSPVFEAEFYGSMAESKMDCITINEMMPSEFKAMLDFMYKGSISVDAELSDDEEVMFYQNLIVAADRYAVGNLKLLCEDKLIESLSSNTVLSLLELAEKHNCIELKSDCLHFILERDNSVPLMVSEEYIKVMQKYPSLLVELKEMASN